MNVGIRIAQFNCLTEWISILINIFSRKQLHHRRSWKFSTLTIIGFWVRYGVKACTFFFFLLNIWKIFDTQFWNGISRFFFYIRKIEKRKKLTITWKRLVFCCLPFLSRKASIIMSWSSVDHCQWWPKRQYCHLEYFSWRKRKMTGTNFWMMERKSGIVLIVGSSFWGL